MPGVQAAYTATRHARLRGRSEAQADADFARLRGDAKVCPGCGERLPPEAFNRNWLTPDGRQHRCVRNGCYSRHQALKRSAKLRAGWLARGLDPDLCAYCLAAPASELEHFVPRARGGSDDLANLLPACPGCNRGPGGKHDRDPFEWLATTFPARVPFFRALFPDLEDPS